MENKLHILNVWLLFANIISMALVNAIKEGDFVNAETLVGEGQYYDVNQLTELFDLKYNKIVTKSSWNGTEYKYECSSKCTLYGTPLMAAVSYQTLGQHYKATEYNRLISSLLANQQCNPNAYNNNEPLESTHPIPATALQFAIHCGNSDAVQVLLNHPRFRIHTTDFVYVCYKCDIATLKLINDKADDLIDDQLEINRICTISRYNTFKSCSNLLLIENDYFVGGITIEEVEDHSCYCWFLRTVAV